MCSWRWSCSIKWVLQSSNPHSPVHLKALWDGQRDGISLFTVSDKHNNGMKNNLSPKCNPTRTTLRFSNPWTTWDSEWWAREVCGLSITTTVYHAVTSISEISDERGVNPSKHPSGRKYMYIKALTSKLAVTSHVLWTLNYPNQL